MQDAQRICLALAMCVGLVILPIWLISNFHAMPTTAWRLMKANTSVMVLCSAISLFLSERTKSRKSKRWSRMLGAFVGMLALIVVLEYGLQQSLGVDTLLAPDAAAFHPGRSAPQTSEAFLLLGVVMAFLRVQRGVLSYAIDVCTFLFCLVSLVMLSGYMFGALNLFGVSVVNRASPQTLLVLMLLAFVAFGRRAESGVFSVFLGSGIGGKIARILCPIAIVIPFLLEAGRGFLIRERGAGAAYAAAISSSVAAMLILALVLLITGKIDRLEAAIREMAIRDELTKLYNRRGFYLLAKKSLQIAQRSRIAFSVLFVDLDNLKTVNDKLGHDVGSEFLEEVGKLLQRTFRTTDVIGRVGGDEFVVAGQSNAGEMSAAAQRLENAVLELNALPGRVYQAQFSYGYVTADPAEDWTTLDDLVGSADSAMYATKQRKKIALAKDSRLKELLAKANAEKDSLAKEASERA